MLPRQLARQLRLLGQANKPVCKCNHFRQVKSTQQRGFHIGRPSFSLVGQQLVRNSGGEETLEQRQYSLHLIKGNELFQQKRYRDAVVEYTSALQAQPKDLNALMYLAAAHEALGNTKKTIEYSTAAIERGTEISTDNSNIANEWSRVARAYQKDKKLIEAHTALRESLHVYPSRAVYNQLMRIEDEMDLKIISRIFTEEDIETDPVYVSIAQAMRIAIKITPDGRGRGVYAQKDIAEGDVIFIEDTIAACADLENRELNHCAHCFRLMEEIQFSFGSDEAKELIHSMPAEDYGNLKRELSSQFVAEPLNITKAHDHTYCTSRCSHEHWNNWLQYLHPHISKRSPAIMKLMPSLDAGSSETSDGLQPRDQATIELLTILLAKKQVDQDTWHQLDNIMYTSTDPDLPLLKHEKEQLEAIYEVFPKEREYMTEANFKRYKSVIELNAFSIETHRIGIALDVETPEPGAKVPEGEGSQLDVKVNIDDEDAVKGHGLYRIGSLFNHSCDPNVGMSMPAFSTKTCWTALRPIKAGEELCDSYIPLDELQHDRTSRREMLLNHYKFECYCDYCLSGK